MILAIESSGRVGSVALVREGELLGSREFDTRQEACRLLPPAIAALLQESGRAPGDLRGLAVSRGPGSFNGLRVGLALAKGLAHALRIPVIGISTPQAWAVECAARHPGRVIAVLQPCRRDYVHTTLFPLASAPDANPAPAVVAVAALPEILSAAAPSQPVVLTGDWPDLEAFAARHCWAEADAGRPQSPGAVTIAQLAEPLLLEAPQDTWFTLRPEYVSLSQAERTHGVNLGL